MVGTFYSAPTPEAAPYVTVGQEISEETVICIIEAMKVMNEIKSEVRGVITQVLVDNRLALENVLHITPNAIAKTARIVAGSLQAGSAGAKKSPGRRRCTPIQFRP